MKKWRLCCVPVAPFPIYNSGAFSGGAASLVCPRGLQFCLPAAQKGVTFLFQLKGVGGCPITTYCLFYEFEKGRLPCPWFHPRVLGNRKADSTPTLSANLPHFWETANLPRLSDRSSNLISVVCNTAAGLFLRPTITIFFQGSKPSWQCPAAGPVLPWRAAAWARVWGSIPILADRWGRKHWFAARCSEWKPPKSWRIQSRTATVVYPRCKSIKHSTLSSHSLELSVASLILGLCNEHADLRY